MPKEKHRGIERNKKNEMERDRERENEQGVCM